MRVLGRFLFAAACIYAFLAGLRMVSDFDLGWQMATGRWVVQHHAIPSVDVLSYTMAGQPWIYPIGAGLAFYLAHLVGGFALISWIGAAACCGTVVLLLRKGSIIQAGIAILAVPLIALRTTPRADMFTVVLFAAFLFLLWENLQTGSAPLWLLPLLMVAWVNLHFGFAAGLGLLGAYVAAELLEIPMGPLRRHAALQRLRRVWGWLLSTVLATLVNPWGWGIYRALIRQERANAQQQFWIMEWTPIPLSWGAITSTLGLRETQGAIYLLLAIVILGGIIALLRTQFGAALLLLGAVYPAVRFVRMGAIFACVAVIVGGQVLSDELNRDGPKIRPARLRSILAGTAVAFLMVLAAVRCFDVVTNRHYFQSVEETTFGAGLGWWFPQRAAEFIERESLRGEIFNTFDEGGYLAWKLGPEHRVFIDGRDTLFGVPRIQRHGDLLSSPPDSSLWTEEASRYNIHTAILPLARYDGVQLIRLRDFCASAVWRPVYLDEVSAVFVRRSDQTEELIERFPVNCETTKLPAHEDVSSRADGFNAWANAASVLAALARNAEALAATDHALSLFPDSGFLHWLRANVLLAMGQLADSEPEYLAAVELRPTEGSWSALADCYLKQGRIPDAIAAMNQAANLSNRPYQVLAKVGYLYLRIGHPKDALAALDEAARSAPSDLRAADNGSFDFTVAQGLSGAWEALGNLEKATAYQEEAARLAPDVPAPWRRLAKLYDSAGRTPDADRARERAAAHERQ